ncbi:hypothetical protein QVD17_07925 [Tagetes erecta]|uniref:MULE transposase domain-containing protein n=1 Tax=Tagetes erecta TaxID=13708 RepID=A0AAD8L2B2_TARER|nr:hypothetical protein QVD17_07925 [Tagetes erecta]
MMGKRKQNMKQDTFVYHTDSNELFMVFWVDEIAKINYNAFDATKQDTFVYHTDSNELFMYKMVFVSFTGVNHHQWSVVFGGALIKRETAVSYLWILGSFLEAHEKQPKLVLTEQDPAMKVAVNDVFQEAQHRLCMKHIMDNLPIKIAGDILANTNLGIRINKLAWNTYLTPTEFEERWLKIIMDYNLHVHKWLNDMYQIREQWIPVYFRDLPMCCLMKTPSRIETMTSTPKYMTRLPIEMFASKIYTHEVFLDVRQEIFKGDLPCTIKRIETCEGIDVYVVRHNERCNNMLMTIRYECKAIKGTCKFKIYEFVEKHNHALVDADNMDLTRSIRRQLQFDDVSKCNYTIFGDMLAFDATYHTNQLMIVLCKMNGLTGVLPVSDVDAILSSLTFGSGVKGVIAVVLVLFLIEVSTCRPKEVIENIELNARNSSTQTIANQTLQYYSKESKGGNIITSMQLASIDDPSSSFTIRIIIKSGNPISDQIDTLQVVLDLGFIFIFLIQFTEKSS